LCEILEILIMKSKASFCCCIVLVTSALVAHCGAAEEKDVAKGDLKNSIFSTNWSKNSTASVSSSSSKEPKISVGTSRQARDYTGTTGTSGGSGGGVAAGVSIAQSYGAPQQQSTHNYGSGGGGGKGGGGGGSYGNGAAAGGYPNPQYAIPPIVMVRDN